LTEKKQLKYEQIINASLELFAAKGFYATTIPDIAEALKMSAGNIYNYFKSKDILAKEIIRFISKYLGNELQTINESDATTKEKTGVFTGAYAVNPVNEEKIPIWISDYILISYGTGAIMAVPGHPKPTQELVQDVQRGLPFWNPTRCSH